MSAAVENGDESSPAVNATGVYVTYACSQDYDFDPFTGHLIWHHTSSCEGGGGKTPALANGSVYGRDSGGNLILSADSGQIQGSFSSTPVPAIGAGRAFTVNGGALTADSQSGLGTIAWTFTGDSHLDSAPLLVGNLVFEGSSSGEIYAVDAAAGTSVWSANVGAAIAGPDEQNVSSPLTGLAAGEGTLVVPAASTLTAYASASLGTGTPTNSQAPAILGAPASGAARRSRRRPMVIAGHGLHLSVAAVRRIRRRVRADRGRDQRGIHALQLRDWIHVEGNRQRNRRERDKCAGQLRRIRCCDWCRHTPGEHVGAVDHRHRHRRADAHGEPRHVAAGRDAVQLPVVLMRPEHRMHANQRRHRIRLCTHLERGLQTDRGGSHRV